MTDKDYEDNSGIQDVEEKNYDNWDDVGSYEEYEESVDVITPPRGKYRFSVTRAGRNQDTQRVGITFQMYRAVKLANEKERADLESETRRCILTIFPPRKDRKKDDMSIGQIKVMSRKLLDTPFSNIDEFCSQLEEIYAPDSGNFIDVTVSHRKDRKDPDTVYPKFQNDWKSVDAEGNEL